MASVLITGTSKGIGLEAALAFGRKGHKVLATMRNPAKSPGLAETAKREKLPIFVSAMDVDSDESVSQGIAAMVKEHGPIDVLVNNAGVEIVGSVEETPLAEVRQVMETNYFGVLRCMQALLPAMRQRRSGCIINISSIGGRLASPPLAAYNASKWALEALTESVACEMKMFDVHVALVEPGIIDTAMARRIGAPKGDSIYPQAARFSTMFTAALQTPVPPSLVAEKIVEIAESGTWQLRHLVGPDAAPFLEWRRQMPDEEWVELNGSDDEGWIRRMQREEGPK